jgi:uncharacterized membrane protein
VLWILAFHIIFMVAWFAGLFYLPRLFIYHATSTDLISLNRFKVMEKKLFYFIMMPAGLLTTVFGVWLLFFNLLKKALDKLKLKIRIKLTQSNTIHLNMTEERLDRSVVTHINHEISCQIKKFQSIKEHKRRNIEEL